MNTTTLRNTALTTLLAGSALCAPALGQTASWTHTGGGFWNNSSNWSTGAVPWGAGYQVFLGNLVGVDNGIVYVNADAVVGRLVITDGIMVDADTGKMTVAYDIFVSGQNADGNTVYPSRFRVSNAVSGVDAIAQNGVFTNDGDLVMDGGTATFTDAIEFSNGGRLIGKGRINLNGLGPSSVRLDNNTHLMAGFDTLQIVKSGTGHIDLDGTSDVGSLFAYGTDTDAGTRGELLIQGSTNFFDAFDGEVGVNPGGIIDLDLSNSWVLSPNGEVNIWSVNDRPSTLRGAEMWVNGPVNGTGPESSIENDIRMLASGEINVGDDANFHDHLTISGTAILTDGEINIGPDGHLEFTGSVTNTGASVTMNGGEMSGSAFENADDIHGNGTINNSISNNSFIVAQGGNLVFTSPTTDMDGSGENGQVLADGGDITFQRASNMPFNGGLRAGTGNRVIALGFELSLESDSITELVGGTIASNEPLTLAGTLTASGASKLWAASTFKATSSNTIHDSLQVHGDSVVWPGATFSGAGELSNMLGFTMTAKSGTTFGTTVINNGEFEIDGKASTASFAEDFRTLDMINFDIVSPALHDKVNVAGDLRVGGTVRVRLTGDGLSAGDSFDLADFGSFSKTGYVFDLPNPGVGLGWDTTQFESTGVISVVCTVDANGDGSLDYFDVAEFLTLYQANDPAADINNDGLVNFFDVASFLTVFQNGCP